MTFKVTASTMGVSSPASVADDADDASGGYHYKRDPTWTPNDPRYRDDAQAPSELCSQNAVRSAGKRQRLAEFARLTTEEGLTQTQAAARLGICLSTAQEYAREIKRQRGEGRDA